MLRSWGAGLSTSDRDELRAAGRAILMLIEEIDRLEADIWNERAAAIQAAGEQPSRRRCATASRRAWFPASSTPRGLMRVGGACGEGMRQAAASARAACRLDAWMPTETTAMRRAQAPIRACLQPASSL